jgi:hypothetical protein
VLGQIPRERRQRRGHHQRGGRRAGHHREVAILLATGVEVVRIAAAPGLLCHLATRTLARRRRTRALTASDATVNREPPTTDTAGTRPEHPDMLRPRAATWGGQFLESEGGSIQESGEALGSPPSGLPFARALSSKRRFSPSGINSPSSDARRKSPPASFGLPTRGGGRVRQRLVVAEPTRQLRRSRGGRGLRRRWQDSAAVNARRIEFSEGRA